MRKVAPIAASSCAQWGQNAVAHHGGGLIVRAVTPGAFDILPVWQAADARSPRQEVALPNLAPSTKSRLAGRAARVLASCGPRHPSHITISARVRTATD